MVRSGPQVGKVRGGSPPLHTVPPTLKRHRDTLGGRGYVATLPTCGPPLMLPRALKRWGPPKPPGLCSHHAHLWAASDSAHCFEAVGTPHAAGVM